MLGHPIFTPRDIAQPTFSGVWWLAHTSDMAIDQGDLMFVHIVTVVAMCPCSRGGLLKLAKLVCEYIRIARLWANPLCVGQDLQN